MPDERMVDWIVEQVTRRPGVSSKWLFENRPRFGGDPPMGALSFDECLSGARERGLRTARKIWWPAGYIGTQKPPSQPRRGPDPKQLNLRGTE